MKHYIIWTKSGNCMEGDMDDEAAAVLMKDYLTYPEDAAICQYKDNDGVTAIAFRSIEILAINDITESQQMGF